MMPDSINDFEVIGHEYVSPEERTRARAQFEWNLRHPDKIGEYPPDLLDNVDYGYK